MIKFLSFFLLSCALSPSTQGFLPQTLKARGGAFSSSRETPSSSETTTTSTQLHAAEKTFGVIVQAEIEPDRMAEFIEMIKNNAEKSRKEPGCLRFDVLRCQEEPNKFFFYELYKNPSAINYHKEQDHYKAWADFKESGGVISSVSFKSDGEFISN